MGNVSRNIVGLFRGIRLVLHIFYGILLALIYPYLSRNKQCNVLKFWSRHLLSILNISIQIEGQQQLLRGKEGCLLIANHVSWLDIFVLNAIHPSHFIAKSEVERWIIIGWLCKRTDTLFIERAVRQNASKISLAMCQLFSQGESIGLFPEGTTTDGKQVGHFHSALIQPAIDAGVNLCPIAIQYQDNAGNLSLAAAFIGDTSLIQSIWRILRSAQLHVLVILTPMFSAHNENRRILSKFAHGAITDALQRVTVTSHFQTAPQASVPEFSNSYNPTNNNQISTPDFGVYLK